MLLMLDNLTAEKIKETMHFQGVRKISIYDAGRNGGLRDIRYYLRRYYWMFTY